MRTQIGSQTLIDHLDDRAETFALDAPSVEGRFVRLPAELVRDGKASGMSMPRFARALALRRSGPNWIAPDFPASATDVPEQTQMLLWQRDDGRVAVALPLIDGDLRATLGGDAESDGLALRWDGLAPGAEPADATLLYVAIGEQPHALVAGAVADVAAHLKTFRLREEKVAPAFADYLGWCTWDAFYHEVDEQKVRAGLQSFADGGVVPGFCIVDDGWMNVHGDLLNDIPANPAKFPHGLAGMARMAKEEFGLSLFGLWHCFMGYWCGLNPDGPLGRRFERVDNAGCIRPWIKGKPVEKLHLLHPDQIAAFYREYHRYLREQGVDLVKVDGQSSLEIFTDGKLGRVSTMRAYQDALQSAGCASFNANVLHCMSNGSDVAYHLYGTTAWRNNADYMPGAPRTSQQHHVHTNVMNNLWSSTFALPDWDMFQTHGPDAAFHAAARAISGGPVYVCDKPGEQDFDLLGKLTVSGGRVLRPDRPALPAGDSLFVDCRHAPRLLKATTRCGPCAMIGLFHCCQDGEDELSDVFRPDDVHDLPPGRKLAAWLAEEGSLEVLAPSKVRAVVLPPAGFELVTISPITRGVAPLGLLDKFAGPGAIEHWSPPAGDACYVRLIDGGRVGFYCADRPAEVRVNGRKARPAYDEATGLLTVKAPAGAPAEIRLVL